MSGHGELCWMSARELRKLLLDREVSATEVVSAHLERIGEVNPIVNAYVTLAAERALREAAAADAALQRGNTEGKPLLGIPFSVKDLIFTEGIRTTSGSVLHADRVPSEDAHCVARLRQAGAIVLGKTNTPEFGFKAVTDNPLFGATRNPWNLEKTAGGSSGGAGAAAAAGLAPLNIGTDGGGSIRIPASVCGIYGLKATFGRVTSVPTPIGWTSLSHPGPMTRTVRDAALMLTVMQGPNEMDRLALPDGGQDWETAVELPLEPLRAGFTIDWGYRPVDAEVRSLVESAVAVFSNELGVEVSDEAPDLRPSADLFATVVTGYLHGELVDYLPEYGDRMDQGLVRFVEAGAGLTVRDLILADQARNQFVADLGRFFQRYDLLLMPTLAAPACDIDGKFPRSIGGEAASPLDWLMTYPFNLSGHPAASVPCGFTSDGLPVGLQVVGRRFREDVVLRASAAFEAARPWGGKRPAIAARS